MRRLAFFVSKNSSFLDLLPTRRKRCSWRLTRSVRNLADNRATTMEGGTERLRLPVGLNVRVGPTWVILYIMLGLTLEQAVRLVDETGKGTGANGTRKPWEVFLGVGGSKFTGESTVRLLLKLALLAGLVWVGIETLYVNQGLFFGANPTTDYLGLVLWGLSADVASRSLSQLRG